MKVGDLIQWSSKTWFDERVGSDPMLIIAEHYGHPYANGKLYVEYFICLKGETKMTLRCDYLDTYFKVISS